MLRAIAPREFFPVFVIILLAWGVGVALPRVMPTLRAGENWIGDFRFGALSPPEPQNNDVVIVAITEDTLATLPYRSPVDRGFLARLLGALEAAKPRAIGIDILFDQPTERAKDEALRKKLRNLSVPVVVAAAGTEGNLTKPQQAFLKRFTDGVATGLVNLVKDRADGVVRWIFPGETIGGEWKPGMVGMLAKFLGLPAPEDDVALAYRNGPGGGTPAFKVYQAHTVALLPKSWFAGKVILIGSDLPLVDRHRTPFVAALGSREGELPGVFTFAHAIAQLMDGRKPPNLSLTGDITLILVLSAVGMVFALFDVSMVGKGFAHVIGLVLFWAGGAAVYRYGGVMIPLLAPTMSFAVCSSLGIAYLGQRDRKQKHFIRNAFSLYVSPSIVDQLVEDPSQLDVGGERRELTYVFTDLANFTSLTESTEPSVLVPLLNEYLDGLCEIMFNHGATIDKIVGDAVISFFNAPVDQPDHAARAVAAALEVDAFGQAFVADRAAQGLTVGITRIGVHSGRAVIGNFGGSRFFDYTGHGDMVNTAARLESVNKHLGTRVCISGVTVAGCPDIRFRPVGTLVLKGKKEGIDVFEPLSDDEAETASVAAYREAFDLMRDGEPKAREAFGKLVEAHPDDPLARFHLRRLDNGESGTTIVMEEK